MTMQKQKGKSYENKIAEYIHNTLYEKCSEYKELFDHCKNDNLKPKRDSSSGTFKHSDNDIDLGLAKKFMPFSIECKHHAKINDVTINALLSDKNAWFIKTMEQAKDHSKGLIPIIFFRGNRTIDMVCFQTKDIDINKGDYFVNIDNLTIMPRDIFMQEYCLKFLEGKIR